MTSKTQIRLKTRTGDMSSNSPQRVPQVRPTLRALKLLPNDDPTVAAARAVLDRAKQAPTDAQRAILSELRLGQLQHPLLDDVRTRLAQGSVPDVHRSSTQAAGRTVYEARSHTGAAWRGTFVLEDDVWWMVFADRHDLFHSTAAGYIKKGTWEPGLLDLALAAQDAAHLLIEQWRVTTLAAVLGALGTAVRQAQPVELQLTDAASTGACTLRLEIEHDDPATSADLAHTTSTMLQVSLLIRGAGNGLLGDLLALLALLGDGEQEQAYVKGGMLLLSTMSHARLAQLTGDVPTSAAEAAQTTLLPAPTVLHYASTAQIAKGFVTGTAALSLCGQWFVPTLDGTAPLPVCATCEKHRPLAQAMLDALRP